MKTSRRTREIEHIALCHAVLSHRCSSGTCQSDIRGVLETRSGKQYGDHKTHNGHLTCWKYLDSHIALSDSCLQRKVLVALRKEYAISPSGHRTSEYLDHALFHASIAALKQFYCPMIDHWCFLSVTPDWGNLIKKAHSTKAYQRKSPNLTSRAAALGLMMLEEKIKAFKH